MTSIRVGRRRARRTHTGLSIIVALSVIGSMVGSASPVGALVQEAGTIVTVAGDGTSGYSGDDGPAVAARIADPSGVAADLHGNFYIADTENNVIRKVADNGTITTIVGTDAGLNLPSGVDVDLDGNVYVADRLNNLVRKLDDNGTLTTVAGNGSLGDGGDGVEMGSVLRPRIDDDASLGPRCLETPGVGSVEGHLARVVGEQNRRGRRHLPA